MNRRRITKAIHIVRIRTTKCLVASMRRSRLFEVRASMICRQILESAKVLKSSYLKRRRLKMWRSYQVRLMLVVMVRATRKRRTLELVVREWPAFPSIIRSSFNQSNQDRHRSDFHLLQQRIYLHTPKRLKIHQQFSNRTARSHSNQVGCPHTILEAKAKARISVAQRRYLKRRRRTRKKKPRGRLCNHINRCKYPRNTCHHLVSSLHPWTTCS